MPFALSILRCPSGRFMFVGNVPPQLAIETDDPSLVEVGARCGMGLAQKIAANRGKYIRTRLWNTSEEAAAEAASLGFEVRL